MPVPIGLLRGFLGVLCVFFTFFLGRSLALRLAARNRTSQLLTWVLRTTVTVLGVLWRGGLDLLSAIVFLAAAVALALGYYAARHPGKQEDLSRLMFPPE